MIRAVLSLLLRPLNEVFLVIKKKFSIILNFRSSSSSSLICLMRMSTLFADIAFMYILIRFFSAIYNLLLFLVNRFRLLFFTGIIVDKHGVKIVTQSIDKVQRECTLCIMSIY